MIEPHITGNQVFTPVTVINVAYHAGFMILIFYLVVIRFLFLSSLTPDCHGPPAPQR